MKQDHSGAFVNIMGSLFLSICLLIGGFMSYSFSKEPKVDYAGPGLDPETYWDESMCKCMQEEEEVETGKTVFLQSKDLIRPILYVKVLAHR